MKKNKLILFAFIQICLLFIALLCSKLEVVKNVFAEGTSGLSYTLIKSGTEYSVSVGTATNVADIEIPSTYLGKPVTALKDSGFNGCTALTSIIIPSSIKTFGFLVFNGCTGLTSVTIPNGVTTIGSGAFQNCTNLASITIPDSVSSVGSYAFFRTIWLDNQPNGVIYVGKVAYSLKGGFSSITLTDGTLAIAEYAFYSATSLTSITLPASLITIGTYAFYNCFKITSISIPDNVTSIGYNAFFCCYALSNISVSSGNADYYSEDGVLFNKDKTTLIYYPSGKQDLSYEISDGITLVETYAFGNCSFITSITISSSVSSIGDAAFYNCTDLTNISVSENSVLFLSENGILFDKNKTTLVCYPAGKQDISYDIPDGITTIGDYSFSCCGITNIIIPSCVTRIDNRAFSECANLTYIKVKRFVPASTGPNTFSGNSELKIYVPSVSLQTYLTTYGWSSYSAYILTYKITTISFNSNGGSDVESILAEPEEAVSEPTDPTKGLCRFDDWFDEDFSNKFVFSAMPQDDITLYAKWFADFTFDVEGTQNVIELQNGKEFDYIGIHSASKQNYTFVGWLYNDEIVTQETIYDYTQTILLTASFEIATYQITFDSNGGSDVESITAEYNASIIKPNDPTKKSYRFVDWYTDTQLENAYTFTVMPNNSFTLYAKWEFVGVWVNFDANGGEFVSGDISQNIEVDGSAVAPVFTRTGYTFNGWDKDFQVVTEDIVVKALWTIKSYNITFVTNGGSDVENITAEYNSSVTKPNDPTKKSYRFVDWYSDAQLENAYTFTVMPNNSFTLYAKWEFVGVWVDFDANGGEFVSGDISQNIEVDGSAVAPVFTRTGYSFNGWDKDFQVVTEDIVVKALWTINNYIVTFVTNGGSNIEPLQVDYNSLILAPSSPTRGRLVFANWFKENTFENEWNFETDRISDSGLTLYAKWNVSITLNVNGSENIVAIETGKEFEEISLQNVSKTGYHLNGWLYNDNIISEETTFDYEQDVNIYANFSPNIYEISFMSDSSTVFENKSVPFDSAIGELPLPEKYRYEFKGWFYNQTLVTAETVYQFTDNIVLTAKWDIVPINYMPYLLIVLAVIVLLVLCFFTITFQKYRYKVQVKQKGMEEIVKLNPKLAEIEKEILSQNSRKNLPKLPPKPPIKPKIPPENFQKRN
ncbi:MAG: InlB B-repeat-containing protein [Clostridia bacterium]